MEFKELYKIANKLAKTKYLTEKSLSGRAAVAMLSSSGKLYTGQSLTVTCSLGFCAETSAIAKMLENNETKIIKMVVVYEGGKIISPCGKCRELMYQVDPENLSCKIKLEKQIFTLKKLLPEL